MTTLVVLEIVFSPQVTFLTCHWEMAKQRKNKNQMPGFYLGDLFSEANYHSVSNDIKIMSQRYYKRAVGRELAAWLAYASHGGDELRKVRLV